MARVFRFLTSSDRRIPEDWFARQPPIATTEGDIDAGDPHRPYPHLTFIANRDWPDPPLAVRARSIQDRLSDALHERLTQRFIDRRTSVLMRRCGRRKM